MNLSSADRLQKGGANPIELLEEGVASGLHPGAQLFAMLRGEIVLNHACGEARPGIAMRSDSLVQWFSSGKPLTAILFAQLEERGQVRVDQPVSEIIPEFAANGKSAITFEHLLTHTAGFRSADNILRDTEWNEVIRRTCEAPLEEGWIPGETAGYSTQASWFVLAEAIQRISAVPYANYIKSELLDPLGITNSWLTLPPERYRGYGDRVAFMYNTTNGRKEQLPLQDPAGMAICRPGASARGPVSELAKFYQMLLNLGTFNDRRFLTRESVSRFTQRHRIGLYDQTFMHTLDYSLGFIINSNRYGAETVPYGYGRFASEETFGHSGAQSSCAFADPVHDLVVAWVATGLPGERAHQQRQRELNSAIYTHLGLV